MKRLLFIVLFIMVGWHPSMADVTEELEQARSQWINAFNHRSNDIQKLYITESGILLDDQFVLGRKMVAKRLLQVRATIEVAHVLGIFKNNERDYLEIGCYDTQGSEARRLYYITALNNVASPGELPKWRRELDVIYPQKGNRADVAPLETARREWEKWAMKHDTLALVQHLYAEDATYFNGGRADTGHKAIASRFHDIMTDTSFSIQLKPKHVVVVQPEYAFEVGYYVTGDGYSAHYALIWKQQADGSWKIILDFNF